MQTALRRFLKRHTDPWIARQYASPPHPLVQKFPLSPSKHVVRLLQKRHQIAWRLYPHRHQLQKLGAFPLALVLSALLMVPIMLSLYHAPKVDEKTLHAIGLSAPEQPGREENAASPISIPDQAEDGDQKKTDTQQQLLPSGPLGKVENDAGYQFYYPYGLTLDPHSGESGAWSTVTLTSAEHAGRIIAAVYATALPDWLSQLAPTTTLSTTMGGLSATKALLPGPQTATAVERFGNVYVVSLKDAGDDPFWTDAYRTATSTFAFSSFGYSQEEINQRFAGVE